jgi:hypothetical protein
MKRKMSKWTEDYDYDDDQVVQIYSYQFVIQVSINSVPDYKHLLQENYVEYKFFFFQNVTQLKKFVYNTLVHFDMCSFCCTENV